MTDIIELGDGELPDDLRALDRELSSFHYEERPSFGPELRAELARAWAEEPMRRSSAFRRHLAAAALAGLLVGGASVPSARASFVRLVGVIVNEPIEVERPEVAPAPVEAVTGPEPVVEAISEQPADALPATPEPVTTTPPAPVAERLVAPEMLDRLRAERLLEEAYPRYLQEEGIGGTVWLRLWVDEAGLPGASDVSRSSGVPELDRIARMVARRFTFAPALQGDRRVGLWIEFPVLFEPDPDRIERTALKPVVDPLALPTVAREEWWQLREPLDLDALPAVPGSLGAEAHVASAEQNLALAMGDPEILERFGPAAAILSGEAPEGIGPTQWRAAVGSALEYAIDRGTENPASLLALGRIRIRQGLRAEARSLFERGLQMAVRDGSSISPWVVAELHHERATLIRDSWLATEGVGRVRARGFATASCAQARSTGATDAGYASAERLIAWNYLCPGEMARIFEEGFELSGTGTAGDLTLMMASYRAAVEAFPGHVPANTDLLVTLASEQRWEDLLAGARRFARVSGGHPNALLLAGLALHRLDRTEEASEHFHAALRRMDDDDADALTDVAVLLDRSERPAYRRMPTAERRAWEEQFWTRKDGSPSTSVNERWVEHMARATFAQLRFGSVFGDAGEVWVRFGEPNIVHLIDEGSGRLTEFWDYGSGPDITFVRWVSSKRTDLTPEGRAYVDDLGKIFPPQ